MNGFELPFDGFDEFVDEIRQAEVTPESEQSTNEGESSSSSESDSDSDSFSSSFDDSDSSESSEERFAGMRRKRHGKANRRDKR